MPQRCRRRRGFLVSLPKEVKNIFRRAKCDRSVRRFTYSSKGLLIGANRITDKHVPLEPEGGQPLSRISAEHYEFVLNFVIRT